MTGLTHVYSAQSLDDAGAIFGNHVEGAVFALFDAEFFPPRAPRFFGVLLGRATPEEICARIDFSVGAAGEGMWAGGLEGTMASEALIPAAFFAGPGAADAGREVAGALAAAAGRAAGAATLGVVLLTTAATWTTAACEEEEEEEEEDLLDDTEEADEEETEEEVEERDSEVVSAICTV